MGGHLAEGGLSSDPTPKSRMHKWMHEWMQVGFFRPNLLFSVRAKQYGVDEEGRPQPLSSLVDYIQEQNEMAQVLYGDNGGKRSNRRTHSATCTNVSVEIAASLTGSSGCKRVNSSIASVVCDVKIPVPLKRSMPPDQCMLLCT
eukprot:1157433-Pelagomonas_calceolata.AAC.4